MTRRLTLLLALVCALVSSAAPARADRERCIAAHEEAQLLRLRGRYTAAREQLLTCAQSSCPALIRDDCIAKLNEVDASLPSVVFAVVDDQGRDLSDVEVWADDVRIAQRLDGRAIALDPGVYTLRFLAAGHVEGSLNVTIHEAQKQRLLRIELITRPPDAPAPRSDVAPASHARRFALSYALGAGALASLAAGVTIGALGKRELDRVDQRCDVHACSAADVAHGKRLYIGADVAFGVAGALAVAATWLFIVTHKRTSGPERVALVPSARRRGAGLALQARF